MESSELLIARGPQNNVAAFPWCISMIGATSKSPLYSWSVTVEQVSVGDPDYAQIALCRLTSSSALFVPSPVNMDPNDPVGASFVSEADELIIGDILESVHVSTDHGFVFREYLPGKRARADTGADNLALVVITCPYTIKARATITYKQ